MFLRGATVLVVDRDDVWRARVACELYRRGYDVLSAADPATMAGLAAAHAVDVVAAADMGGESAGWLSDLNRLASPPRLVLVRQDAERGAVAETAAATPVCSIEDRDPLRSAAALDELLRALGISDAVKGPSYHFDGWSLSLLSGGLRSPTGAGRCLQPGVFRVLIAFLERPGRLLTRRQLGELCGVREATRDLRAVDTRVARIRQTMRALDPDGAPLIATVRGEGYVFVGRVEAVRP